MNPLRLQGCKVLVLEPEMLILMDMQKLFEDAGADVIPAASHDQALVLATTPGLNVAMLDYSVATEDGATICAYLNQQDIPFFFYSGADREMAMSWPAIPFIRKPALPESIIDEVASVCVQNFRNLARQS